MEDGMAIPRVPPGGSGSATRTTRRGSDPRSVCEGVDAGTRHVLGQERHRSHPEVQVVTQRRPLLPQTPPDVISPWARLAPASGRLAIAFMVASLARKAHRNDAAGVVVKKPFEGLGAKIDPKVSGVPPRGQPVFWMSGPKGPSKGTGLMAAVSLTTTAVALGS